MDDIVALEVRLQNGHRRYFLTWGRLFDPVDPASLLKCARDHIREQALGDEITEIRVCNSLQDACREPYFFEALFEFGQTKIPRGEEYETWRALMRVRLEQGRDFYYLGESTPS